MSPWALWTLRIGMAAAALGASLYALILARAEYLFKQDTAVSVAAAVRLQPRNAAYLDRLASWQTEQRKALLERAVKEDPFNFNAWMRLGFLAEMQEGNTAAAERNYLKAAEVNHMFLPKWTLANFYFRQQRRQEFFHWTREALTTTPYASDAVFAQLWQMTQNEDELEAVIPNRARILLQYAWYLANAKIYDRVPHAVERLAQVVGKDDPGLWGRDDLLASSLDYMIAAGNVKAAQRVWSVMHAAGWLKEAAPDERHALTNGDFQIALYRHGFDWVPEAGARLRQYTDIGELRVSVAGQGRLLHQYVACEPGAAYRITWQAESRDMEEGDGLAWHFSGVRSAAPEQVSKGLLSSGKAWTVAAPPDAQGCLLSLESRSARARGEAALRAIEMNRQ